MFPLPDFVLFPLTSAPLHVFELRYRTMVRDALSGERVIALALLQPGWEGEYEGSPPFHPLGCLARFEEVEWLPNDCYNLVVTGLARLRLDRVVREFPYRAARGALLPQEPYSEDDPLVLSEKQSAGEQLLRLIAASTPSGPPGEAAWLQRLGEASFESVVNALCMRVRASGAERQELLALDSVVERGRCARELAARGAAPPPPETGEHN